MNPDSPATVPSVQWTPAQRDATLRSGCNLVVSASAGSGKTAVLTERVFTLLAPSPAENRPPAALERMLIITFTEKAATQMKERIERRIRQALAEPGREPRLLREALNSLSAAWIMTIDAFCRRLVSEHFHRAQIPPAPRLVNGAELAELELRELRELLSEALGGPARAEVEELTRSFGRGVEGLLGALRDLIHFMHSLDRPADWLAAARERFERTADPRTAYPDLPEAQTAGAWFRQATRELNTALRALIREAERRGGEAKFIAPWHQLALDLDGFAQRHGPFQPDALAPWLERADPILGKLGLKRVCGPTLFQDQAFKAHFLDPFGKHYLKHWRESWFFMDEAGLLRGARLAATQCLTLLALAQRGLERLQQRKRRLGLVTFNDYERYALEILTDPGSGRNPSEIALQLRRQFEHVLVDEYQDTSPLQDSIIRQVARPGGEESGQTGNLFLVGDYKQSIYRFRDADPALFRAKLAAATGVQSGAPGFERINLLENFRSRGPVLCFINAIFERLMDESVGEIEYGAAERLAPQRPEPAGSDPVCVEVHWMAKSLPTGEGPGGPGADGPEEENEGKETAEETDGADGLAPVSAEALEGLEAQAQWVARRIRELTDPARGLLIPEEGADPLSPSPPLRRARPGDCAIIVRGLSRNLELWVEALESEGIKVRSPGVNPLFSAPELVDLMNALRVADNPFQDLALAALLRSPMVGFDEDELLRLRLERLKGPFHAAVWAAAGRDAEFTQATEISSDAATDAPPESSPEPLPAPLADKLARCLDTIDRWRALARRRPADEVLAAILGDTHYEAWLMGHEDGAARLEHLDFLRGLLRNLGRSDEGANPLASFLELVERAREESDSLGDLPETVAKTQDAVNLLTIHKSKGLEFPIVFLPRLERRFDFPESPETLFEREGGLARPGVDTLRRRRYPTLARRILAESRRRKDRSEELRLLYVAMTRARERLILVGQLNDPEASRALWRLRQPPGQADQPRTLDPLVRLHAVRPVDLIGPVVEELLTREGGEPAWLQVRVNAEVATATPPADLEPLRRALHRDGADSRADWDAALAHLSGRIAEDGWTAGETEAPDPAASPPLHLLPPLDPARLLTALPAKATVTQLRRLRHGAPDEAARQREGDSPDAARGIVPSDAEDDDAAEREEEAFIEAEMRAPYRRESSLADHRPSWSESGFSARSALECGGLPPLSEAPVKQSRSTNDDCLDARRRGSLIHAFLERLELAGALDEQGLKSQAERLLAEGALGEASGLSGAAVLQVLDLPAIAWFFSQTEPGRAMARRPGAVLRELPFTASRSLYDLDLAAGAAFPDERLIVQGIADAVLDEGETVTVIDYKTDHLRDEAHGVELAARYRPQLTLYARSLQAIWLVKRLRAALVFLGARRVVWLDEPF